MKRSPFHPVAHSQDFATKPGPSGHMDSDAEETQPLHVERWFRTPSLTSVLLRGGMATNFPEFVQK